MIREALDCALIEAFAADDRAAIARLYAAAGDQSPDIDEACFFWVQAYVFALEEGMPEAETYRLKLVAEGRER